MISIIIPTYNEEKTIQKTLKSIEKNKGNYEVIIIDAGNDDLEMIIKKYKKNTSLSLYYQKAFSLGRAPVALGRPRAA